MSTSSSPSSMLRPGALQPSPRCSPLPLPESSSSVSGYTPNAITLIFSRPVPWRVTGNDGAVGYQWSKLGRTAEHWAHEWARKHQGIAKFGYITGVSEQQLDMTDNWNDLPLAEVSLTNGILQRHQR